jgi:hypothetical protein
MSLVLTAVQFNHDPASSKDSALNIRKNASAFLPVPEWRRGATLTPESSVAAYSIEDTVGQMIKIKASFRRMDPRLTSAEVRAMASAATPFPVWWPQWLFQQYAMTPTFYYPYSLYALYAGIYQYLFETVSATASRVLGDVKPKRVQFGADGQTGLETFELVAPQLDRVGVGIHTLRWAWQYRRGAGDVWENIGESSHRIYALLRKPTAPWKQMPFRAANTQLPWTDVMDYACQWASGARDVEDAGQQVTRNLFDLGSSLIEYDCAGGGNCHYATPVGAGFDCTAFLGLLRGGPGNDRYVNCTDCATIVSTFANVLGCDLWQSRMGTLVPPGIIFFGVNPIMSIGSNGFSLPCGWPGFTYHEVAWTNNCRADDEVYDACCQVNGTADPSRAPRIPLLAAGLRFGAAGDGQYRDRLASPAARAVCEPRPSTRVRRIVF